MTDIGIEARGARRAGAPYRDAVFFLGLLALLVVPAFWPSYLFPPKYESDWHVHLHGVAMFAWVALLVAQAWLIRARRPAHRALGKVSFVLVPLIVYSTLSLAHYRMRHGLDAELLYFFYVQLSLLAIFVTSYVLAIANRRSPAVHARYMVCTALAIFDPIVARLLGFYLGIDWPYLQMMTFAMIDGILAWLLVRDIQARFPKPVFPAMLALVVATQIPTFFISDTPVWKAFAAAFAAAPLP